MYKTLRGTRVASGERMEDAARVIDVALTTFSYKERGETDFTLTEAKKLAKHYNKPLTELFPDDEGPDPFFAQEVR